MKERHVILRATKTASGGFLGGAAGSVPSHGGLLSAGPAMAPAVDNLVTEVDDLDPAQASAVAASNDVIAVAPVMQMRLVEPLEAPAEMSGVAADWGIQAVKADTSPFTGANIVVAVLDTGIDPNHAAFNGVNLVRKNFTNEGPDDQHGHGTHCAGTIFGRDVNGTRIGVARGVNKALIGKVLGTQGGGSADIVEAIQWAVQEGANIISMSLGIDFTRYQKILQQNGVPQEVATSRALEAYRANVALFERLASMLRPLSQLIQTTLLIAAAGNESRRNIDPDFTISVSPPAAGEGLVSVAALGLTPQGFKVAPFSNIGALVAGPGVNVTSAKAGGGLTAMSGTSMATPYVAGVGALWAEKLSGGASLNPQQLLVRLVGSGDKSGLAPGFNPVDVGTGMVQAPQ